MSNLSRAMRIFAAFVILVALCANMQASTAQPNIPPQPTYFRGGDELWKRGLTLGANNAVYAIAIASNNDVYVGGMFTAIGDVAANHIARRSHTDGRWYALGNGITTGSVLSLTIANDSLYVGGMFTRANGTQVVSAGIARWNIASETWSTVGGAGFAHTAGTAIVKTLITDPAGNVYAGGEFTSVNGLAVSNVAKWNGSAWSALGALGGATDSVAILLWQNTGLVAGGNFGSLGNIAKWNGSSWGTLGAGTNGLVRALASDATYLYAGGTFDTVTNANASTVTSHGVARWKIATNTWESMDSGLNADAHVSSLKVGPDNKLYLGGDFATNLAGTITLNNVACWDGTWHALQAGSELAKGVGDNIYAMEFLGTALWIGGIFQSAGSHAADRLAYWNLADTQWHIVSANAPNGTVYTIFVSAPYVYLGGAFSLAGNKVANGIVRYSMQTGDWDFLGDGVSGCQALGCHGPTVYVISMLGNDLFVGGDFTTAGGESVNGLARYNTTSKLWSSMGGGVTDCTGMLCTPVVRAIVPTSDDTVIVGGLFTKAGGITVNNVAKYTLSSDKFTALTDSNSGQVGTNGAVYALAEYGGGIYAGGSFSVPAAKIANFYNNRWYSVGSGTLNGNVFAIADAIDSTSPDAAADTDIASALFIGGEFTDAGGSGANYLARLSSGSWQPVGSGVNGTVTALVGNYTYLVIGGQFDQAGGQTANHLAIRNNGKWLTMGSGVASGPSTANTVTSVALAAPWIYAGGSLRSAGPYPSDNFAVWGGFSIRVPLVRR